MDIQEIMNVLPHRYPFLLVDRVVTLEKGTRCVAIKQVSINEPFFQGHFPQKPVMPGVLILEAMAQAGGIVVLSLEDMQGKLGFLGAVNKAKFRRMVVPGDILTLDVTITRLRSNAAMAVGLATVDGKRAAEAEFTFMIGNAE